MDRQAQVTKSSIFSTQIQKNYSNHGHLHDQCAICRFQRRENCTHPDAALAACGGSTFRKADISALSPAGAPGIFYLPILLAVVTAVADSKHPMIEICSASTRRQNSSRVMLKHLLVCFDSDGDRLLRHGCFQSAF